MNTPTEPLHFKPVIVLPVGEMTKKDIDRLNRSGFCVVECKTPSAVRFLDPPTGDWSQRDMAAIQLCRQILVEAPVQNWSTKDIGHALAVMLMRPSVTKTVEPVKPVIRTP